MKRGRKKVLEPVEKRIRFKKSTFLLWRKLKAELGFGQDDDFAQYLIRVRELESMKKWTSMDADSDRVEEQDVSTVLETDSPGNPLYTFDPSEDPQPSCSGTNQAIEKYEHLLAPPYEVKTTDNGSAYIFRHLNLGWCSAEFDRQHVLSGITDQKKFVAHLLNSHNQWCSTCRMAPSLAASSLAQEKSEFAAATPELKIPTSWESKKWFEDLHASSNMSLTSFMLHLLLIYSHWHSIPLPGEAAVSAEVSRAAIQREVMSSPGSLNLNPVAMASFGIDPVPSGATFAVLPGNMGMTGLASKSSSALSDQFGVESGGLKSTSHVSCVEYSGNVYSDPQHSPDTELSRKNSGASNSQGCKVKAAKGLSSTRKSGSSSRVGEVKDSGTLDKSVEDLEANLSRDKSDRSDCTGSNVFEEVTVGTSWSDTEQITGFPDIIIESSSGMFYEESSPTYGDDDDEDDDPDFTSHEESTNDDDLTRTRSQSSRRDAEMVDEAEITASADGQTEPDCSSADPELTEEFSASSQDIAYGGNFERICTFCSKTFTSEKRYKGHLRTHQQSFFCQYCSFSVNPKKLSQYNDFSLIMTHHRKEKHPEHYQKYLCDVCGRGFVCHSGLARHKAAVHYDTNIRARLQQKCPDCDDVLPTKVHLRNHINKVHSKEVTCPHVECGKVLKNSNILSNHLRIVHSDTKRYVCTIEGCNARFPVRTYLQKHIARKHIKQRNYMCDFPGCGKTFFSVHNMKVHKRVHTAEKPLKCPHCDFHAAQRNSINWHLRKHAKEKT